MEKITIISEQQKIIRKSYIDKPAEHPKKQDQYWTVKGINNIEPLKKEWWVYNPGSGVPHSFSEREIKNKFYQYPANNPANMARKHNVTGIKMLSIGTTKNDRGYVLTRYTVNYKASDKNKAKSFYFGQKQSQREAFDNACEFMMSKGLLEDGSDCAEIYKRFNHQNLV